MVHGVERRDVFGCRGRSAPLTVGVRPRDRGDQQLRVRMLRVSDHLLRRSGLHDLALVEHHDVVRDMIGRGQVMRDVEYGDSVTVFQIVDVLQDRGAKAGINHRDGFVGNEKLWVQHQRSRHDQALALSAGKLVRIAAKNEIGIETHGLARLVHPVLNLRIRSGVAESPEREAEGMVHAVEWIEAGVGILEDRLHVLSEDARLLR